MWVLPKQLITYPYVQGTEALISDSQELSKTLEQSVMWRSNPSPSKTWSRRLKRDGSTLRLFTQTLKHSLSANFVDAWTSSLGVSRVSPSALLDKDKGQKTLATSSPISSMESDCVDLPLFSWKMSKELSVQNSKATNGATPKAHPFCSMSLESWKGWVTSQRQEYSARLKSVRPTNAKEFLSSQETDTQMSLFRFESVQVEHTTLQVEGQHSTDGNHQGLFWATPRSRDGKGVANQRERGYGAVLPDQVKFWTTPTARDHYESTMKRETPPRKDGRLRMDTMPRQVHHEEGYKGRLNPRFVETLMGIPVGWTMPSCANPTIIERTNCDCSETELFPQPQNERLGNCGQDYKSSTDRRK